MKKGYKYLDPNDLVFDYTDPVTNIRTRCLCFDLKTKFRKSKVKFYFNYSQYRKIISFDHTMFCLSVGDANSSFVFDTFFNIEHTDTHVFEPELDEFYRFSLQIMTLLENGPKNLISNNETLMSYINFLDEFFLTDKQDFLKKHEPGLSNVIQYKFPIYEAYKKNIDVG